MRNVMALSLRDGDEQEQVADDAALVAAAREDPAAFEALYHRYLDRVYAYLRTRTSSTEDAADLTQQVFLQALDALPRYRGGTFAAWLFRIAHNLVANFYARRKTAVAWDLVPDALQPLAGDDPEAGALRREALDRLRDLLMALDSAKRELLALRFAAGLSVAEIAAVIGKSEAATRKSLYRTIQTLQEQYHDQTR